ncbi:hypothetical protein [Macrococcus sp. DPC7161]|uniref:hypothetical protein n=1 Tax=Macrococcus sp. DPC7161 TaxID=2507060 RepID=UPI00100A8112|nr:hypothetical protein [Macrococcus sp. DPC7161]RXK19282.1 hypothetical protein ER639_02895 [Macrococcus sp. DPC7161]
MSYLSCYEMQIETLKKKYPYFKPIDINRNLCPILDQIQLKDNIKSAILSIDTSMRMQDVIQHENKDISVLSSDILSALFYHYMSIDYDAEKFNLLTHQVKVYNEQSTLLIHECNQKNVEKIKFQLTFCFVLPFICETQIKAIINQLEVQ